MQVGDIVVAIGSPFGLGQTVTSGIVSALGRTSLGIEGYEDFIQTDASINPGNSGGALVNLQGELVGINTAIVGPAGGNVGIGFAIPINMVTDVVNQIIKYGDIQRGQLGVQIQDLTPALARAFDISQSQGAVVAGVIKGSPADQAGILRGDVVIAMNGQKVDSASKLRNRVALMRVGDTVSLDILREGQQRSVEAALQGQLPILQAADPVFKSIRACINRSIKGQHFRYSSTQPCSITVGGGKQRFNIVAIGQYGVT